MKRIVTGHSQDGKSEFVSIGESPRTVTVGRDIGVHGTQVTYCWDTQKTPLVPARGDDPTLAMSSFFPAPGGTSFIIAQFPGNTEGPPHTTNTVDYVTILSGEIWLVLDDGAEVHLTSGDCVVQNGTQHAWHNRNPEPCVFVAVTVGAERQDDNTGIPSAS
jgi:mannose-6-phosphate isomerase-like protein (cupin superfamily)